MLRALNTAATGMASQESHVSTISNNIANANTTAFKQGRTEFEDLLYETLQEPGGRSSGNTQYNVGIQIGSGSKVSATRRIHSQGNPIITNNPFDLMINGEGFFGVIDGRNQIGFTRDGSFNIDAQGNLVTRNGGRVFPGITVPPNTSSISVGENGTVEAYISGQVQPQNIGQIPVFTFINPVGLRAKEGNLLTTTTSSGEAIQNISGENNAGVINQGALEASNVNMMTEMTNLIKAQRAYQANAKVMGIADQMLNTINTVR